MSASLSLMLGSSSIAVFSSTALRADGASLPLAAGFAAGFAAGVAAGLAAGVAWASASAGAAAINTVARRTFMRFTPLYSMTPGFEPAQHFFGQLPSRLVCPLQHLPVVAVAR